jgi:hypothetical protein
MAGMIRYMSRQAQKVYRSASDVANYRALSAAKDKFSKVNHLAVADVIYITKGDLQVEIM